ncbi:MAG: hypothetical protein Q7K16_03480 [Candidatus Azambacteria bacterium]|nr:hypothetical protein [Candidatus Azambacteria bacterium]
MSSQKSLNQVEKELLELIHKYELENLLKVKMVKDWAWNEQGAPLEAVHKFQEKFINCFPQAENIDELNGIMRVAMDAWNFFPHKILNGKLPLEVAESGRK